LRIGRGKEVHHAAADAELAVLVHGVFRRKTRIRQTLAQCHGRDLAAGFEDKPGVVEPAGLAEPRHQCARRRDDQSAFSRGEREQGTCTGRRDLEMRAEAPVRIHFL
jgi:hypothetical protein